MPGYRGLGTTRNMAAELPVVLDVLSDDLESFFGRRRRQFLLFTTAASKSR